ncbi:hypothetical protein [Pectobacterium parmentieri]|uniref:hypothetical protein n=1 Tax=Pectobacterium parmentieri TaxID=1905730 RepID=UPI000EAB8D5B|nr:hypothetical protein [Pectobacterium parmentieri]AYH32993.1 hypothetical protein C5E19_15960 [Pectobacterium parmentieri]
MNISGHLTPIENNQLLDTYQKLKQSGSHYPLLLASNTITATQKYIIQLIDYNFFEFALYKNVDGYFLLVDFFNEYEEANEEAKKIIDGSEKFKKFILSNQG